MNKSKLIDVLNDKQLEKINSAAYTFTKYCEKEELTPLEFVYTLIHLLMSVKESDKELNTDFGLLIDLYL